MGAAIAAGSQAENGIWALLVIAAIMIKIATGIVFLFKEMRRKFQEELLNRMATANKIVASPIRLDSAVSIPAALDLLFW